MKFIITRTSSDDYMEIKEISTIEELIKFRNEVKEKIIIKRNFWYNEGEEGIKNISEWYSNVDAKEVVTIPNGIEIYDDYRE